METSFYLLLALATLASASIPTSAIVNSVSGVRQRRSFKVPIIGSLLGGKTEPVVPNIGTYPLWKVHRYHGISLQPVPYPGETVPSTLPASPSLPGEPPSIVNVPDPNYAPVDAVNPPANEYGPPANEYGPPANEYGPPASAPASYPSAPAPAAPYPVYGAPYRAPRGPVSSSVEAATGTYASSTSSGGDGDLSGLLGWFPPEVLQKVQQYASTLKRQEKVNALFGIADSARKLKSNAAHSIQGVFEKFFGGAGGSTNVALNSGTYTNIPEVYPAPQGIFNKFKAVGTGISGSLLPNIPEVPPLPAIPGLQKLPPTPQLPHINLPDISHLSSTGLGGRYVSISLPQPAQAPQSPPEETYGLPAPSPAYAPPPQQYSVPQIPSTSYGSPVGPVYSYPQSSGSGSPYYQTPRQNVGAPDAFSAASEIQEQFESRDGEEQQQQQQEEDDRQAQVPLKTTKLHRVQDSRPFHSEGLRAYLDSNHAAFRPSHQDYRPAEQSKQTDNEINEDSQE